MNDTSFEFSKKTELDQKPLDVLQKKSTRLILVALLSIVMPLSLWGLATWTYGRGLDNLRQQLDSRMNLYSSNIVSEVEKYEYLPVILARDPLLQIILHGKRNAKQVDEANRHLSAIRETTQISAVYVMSAKGITLAASNWEEEASFVGKNFRFRPYFKNAMQGKVGHYFALGTTSKIPGYFLSYPIEDKEGIKGVVVVKVSVARLEKSWARAKEEVVITDNNGVIIISSADEWKFRTFDKLDVDVRKGLLASRQYSNAPLRMLQSGRKRIIDKDTVRLSIRHPLKNSTYGNVQDSLKWEDIYLRSRPVLGTDWTIHYIFRESQLREDVIENLVIAAFTWLIAILTFLYFLQRRNMVQNRLNFQIRHQKALEEAAVELERRVERRTQALSQANTDLEKEIKERLKTEENLYMAQDELVQAGKLAALGQMAAGITHEMNQPLTAIRSYSDNATVLLERNRIKDVQSNLLQISSLCDRLAKISGQLKLFSRKAPSTIDPLSISKVMDEALTLFKNSAQLDTVVIHNDIQDENIMVLGEMIRLEQVILNILRNALDAMNDITDPTIWISCSIKNRRVAIHIRDNGSGLKDKDMSFIFDPFFTTKEVGEGIGLGLSISSRIIQDFGGVLKASNHIDGGAIFTIDLLQQANPNG